MKIPLHRGAESCVVEIDDRRANETFGGVPLDMIGCIRIGPVTKGVPVTPPGPKEKERPRRMKEIEHEEAGLL